MKKEETPLSLRYDKERLGELCDSLLLQEPGAVEKCFAFFEAETFGIWHGRGRAMMARRFKHCRLSPSQAERIVNVVILRFEEGRFSEQFKDQLGCALHLAPERVFKVAKRCQASPWEYVRRYAVRIISRIAARSVSG